MKPYAKFFFTLFFAFFSLTCGYAIWRTQGKTVLSLGLLILLVIAISNLKKIARIYRNITFKELLAPFLYTSSAFLIGFSANALMIFDFTSSFGYHIPNIDLVGYSNYVNMLNVTGQENYNGFSANYFSTAFHGVSPYHFYEFWLAAFFSKVFGLQAVISYWLVVYPLFYCLVFCGLLAVAEQKTKITSQIFFWCFLLLFVGAIYFPFYQFIPYGKSIFYLHNNTLLTYGLIEPFLLAAYLCYQAKNSRLAWLMILLCPLVSITTWAGVVGLLLYLCLSAIYKRDFKYFLQNTLLSFLILTLSLVIFFSVFGTKNQATFSWKELLPIFAFSNLDFSQASFLVIKSFGLVFLLYLGKSVIAYFPFLLVVFPFLPPKYKKLQTVSKLIVLLLPPLSAMFLLILHHDSSQVFRNFLFPLLNIFLIIKLIDVFLLSQKKLWFCYGLIAYQIIFSIYFRFSQTQERNIYSQEYLVTIAQIQEKELKIKFGGFLYGKDFYPNDLLSKVIRHNIPAGYLSVMPQFYTIVNLEIFDIPKSNDIKHQVFEERSLKNSEFYQFVAQQKSQNQFKSYVNSQIDFIKTHQLVFLVIGKNVNLSQEIMSLSQKTITDTATGERFLLLK